METKQPRILKSAITEVLSDINSKREKALAENACLQQEPSVQCAACHDTETIWNQDHTRARTCQCKLDKRALSIIQRTVPEIYRNAPRLKDIKPCRDLPVTVKRQTQIIKGLQENPLIGQFFRGPSGTGKSYLMWALYKEALHKGRNAHFTSCRDLISRLRKEEFRRASEPPDLDLITVDDLKPTIFGPFHLFIDEWGKIQDNDYAYNQLFSIVDYCCSNPSSVVLSVSTNYSESDFIEIYGEALLRRLNESCDVVFYGE